MAIVASGDLSFTDNAKKNAETKEAVTIAQAAADNAQKTANNALTSADGKSTNYYGQTLPAGDKLKENDTWFCQNAAGICIGIYQYVGGAWVKSQLDQNALKVGSLSAINANLGNVTAGNMSGVNLNLGTYNSTTGKYPFQADKNGKVYMSDLTVNNASSTNVYGFTPYVTIGDGKWQGFSRIKRLFDNEGVEQSAYYDVITTIDGGQFRAQSINKKSTQSGTDTTFNNYTSRSLFMSERGITTSDGIFKGTTSVGSSRYIDFWPGENGYNGSVSSQRGMEIFSGAGMRIAGGTKDLYMGIEAGGELNISAGGELYLSDKKTFCSLSDIYINGSGGGTLNSGKFLSAGGIVSNAAAFFIGAETYVHITDKSGYNNGNGYTYMPLKASTLYANALDINTGTHLYLRPSSGGVARVTAAGSLTTYKPIQASSFDVSSSYTYKQDIKQMTRSALEILDALKIYEYRMIDDVQNGIEDNWKIGLIAEYSPQVALDDNMKIDTYKMLSMNWKATQDLYQIVKGLLMSQEMQEIKMLEMENTINEQKELMSDLDARIAALENK